MQCYAGKRPDKNGHFPPLCTEKATEHQFLVDLSKHQIKPGLYFASNKVAQIWNNLQLNNAKSIADVRASALEWYRTNLQN